jgi:hypothetical protein
MDDMNAVLRNSHPEIFMAFQNVDHIVKLVACESLSSSFCTLFADLSRIYTGTV